NRTSMRSSLCICGKRRRSMSTSSQVTTSRAAPVNSGLFPSRRRSATRSMPPPDGAYVHCRFPAQAFPLHEVAVIKLNINGRTATVDADPDTPLLWVLRDNLGLTGTKYGCGIAACGACTVHVDGSAVRSCSFPLSEAKTRKITTIEGLSRNRSHPV